MRNIHTILFSLAAILIFGGSLVSVVFAHDGNGDQNCESYGDDNCITPTPSVTPYPSVTPTPTVAPTLTPSPSITPTPTPTCEDNEDSEGINPKTSEEEDNDDTCITPTPTPTVAPTATPTQTPPSNSGGGSSGGGPGSGVSDGRSDGLCSKPPCVHPGENNSQAVLGASTFGSTGTFEQNLMNLFAAAGIGLVTFSSYKLKRLY